MYSGLVKPNPCINSCLERIYTGVIPVNKAKTCADDFVGIPKWKSANFN
jgi:hypothetical protein